MRDTEFVIIDVETTGLYPDHGDRVIEVAALKFRDLKVVGEFDSLINPQCLIPYEATSVNGISNDMVADAPLAVEVMPKLVDFLKGTTLIGHNVKFDIKFLNSEIDKCSLPNLQKHPAIDTVKMSRGLLTELDRHALAVIAEYFGIEEEQQHRAMADVEMTFDVFKRFVKIAEENNIAKTETLLELFGTGKVVKQNKSDKLKLIEDAIALNRDVEILYFGAASGPTTRVVKPAEVGGSGKDAVLKGFCQFRQADREFVVDRIVKVGVPSEIVLF